MRTYRHLLGLLVVFVVSSHAGLARGQGYGSDLQNVMAPASGGMAGVSTALPQDVPSAVFGNPATLAQFEGTQFTMGGGWVEGYPTVVHTPDGFIGTPFSATSRTEGAAATEIGVTQDLRSRRGGHAGAGTRWDKRRRAPSIAARPRGRCSTTKAANTWCWASTWGPAIN